MGFLLDKCKLKKMDDEILSTCHPFTCGDEDLDDFFLHDAMRYKAELLGKTYCFVLDDDPKTIVCMFTLSNDSIRVDVIPNSRGRKLSHDIPREKRMRRYPAVLIGRLGINVDFRHQGIGSELLDFIKSWFIDEENKIKPSNMEKFGKFLQKAQAIITELQVSLDMEKGGEIAKNLMSLYIYFNQELISVNIKHDKTKLEYIEQQMSELLKAWKEASASASQTPVQHTQALNIEG